MSNKTSKLLSLDTSELRKGDVVHTNGMEVYLDDEPKTWTSRNGGEAEPCTVFHFKGRVLNLRAFRASSWARVIPMSWLYDEETKRNNVWVVQGNHLARWSVEREERASEPQLCQWFALCTNEATTTVRHPVLGDVPTCARCADKARRED